MRILRNMLHDLEPGELRIIAERWAFEPETISGAPSADRLAGWMLQPDNLAEVLAGLTDDEGQLLLALRQHTGRMPLDEAEHRFGAWRRMGAARRDRLQPHRYPLGPLESLGYTGLIGRAFADAAGGPQEVVYLPSDFLPLLPALPVEPLALLPAPEPSSEISASPWSAEDSVTLLAALRRRGLRSLDHLDEWLAPIQPFLLCPDSTRLLITLLSELGVLSEAPHRPQADQAGRFLQSLQDDPHRLLADWKSSRRWGDLSQVPSISCETRTWPGDPVAARLALLEILDRLAPDVWYELSALVGAVREERPGFQRTAGEFDSWYLRHRESGEFLRGFEHWDAVEGELIRTIVCGPLHWLGAADLGRAPKAAAPDRFRLHQPGLTPSASGAKIEPDGRIDAPLGMPHPQRYQLARFCSWESRSSMGFTYRLTPSALRLAQGQGLRPPQIVAILEAASGQPLVAHLQQAVLRTDLSAIPQVEAEYLLRIPQARQLEALLASKETARLLGDRVGKDRILIRPGMWERLQAAAARMGILIDGPTAEGSARRRR